MSAFRRGAYFSASVFRSLRRFAMALLVGALLRLAVTPAAGLLLSLGQDRGSVSLRLGTGDVLALLLAGGIWLMAWILMEAAEIEAENRQIV